MKLQPRRFERRPPAKALITEPTRETCSVAESLEFLKPGDLQLIEQIALDPFATNERDTRAAFALPGLIFTESPVGQAFEEERDVRIGEKRALFEAWVASASEVFEGTLHTLYEAAEDIFPLRGLLERDLTRLSEEAWKMLQKKVHESAVRPQAGPSPWLVKLLYLDPVRFQELLSDKMRQLCLQHIAEEREKYPVSKDKRQIRLLHALATTRLMFPDMVDAESLTTEEREVTREYLEKERACAKNEGGTSFAFYVYLLSIVEAPSLKVDEKGIHLGGKKLLAGKIPELPVRSEVF